MKRNIADLKVRLPSVMKTLSIMHVITISSRFFKKFNLCICYTQLNPIFPRSSLLNFISANSSSVSGDPSSAFKQSNCIDSCKQDFFKIKIWGRN